MSDKIHSVDYNRLVFNSHQFNIFIFKKKIEKYKLQLIWHLPFLWLLLASTVRVKTPSKSVVTLIDLHDSHLHRIVPLSFFLWILYMKLLNKPRNILIPESYSILKEIILFKFFFFFRKNNFEIEIENAESYKERAVIRNCTNGPRNQSLFRRPLLCSVQPS
ncbi:hypothetical protein BpHYR1_014093 [Brachionus plicatilis]|uniref:Uncharacterized protein n=1 Tax=Brachionus plicatilis TaxID=10195 RepID=A0A3M7Q100_BRAPC|nr:hypothetical protein BpHYR1_014093 [Brachionus plicatilis]